MLETIPDSRSVRSVADWLEAIPSPSNKSETGTSQRGCVARKRKQGSERPCESPKKSQRLAEITGNVMRQNSPRKKRGTAKEPTTPFKSTRHEHARTEDNDKTPRPNGVPLRRAPSFEGPAESPFESFDARSSHPSESADSSHASARSQSPQKHLGHTYISNVSIDRKTLASHTVPSELSSLYCDLNAISTGVGVIPRSVEAQMKEAGIYYQAHELRGSQGEDQKDSSSLGPQSFYIRMHEIWEIATDCLERNVAEPRWNAEVHSRLLYSALRGEWQSRGIWYEDITTARITDKDLLAKIGTSSVQSKLVDYAIMIDPDHKLKRRIAQAAKASTQSAAWSINCTAVEYIQLNPIAISIETKRETSSRADPYPQLGTWTTAHYLKLRQLTKPLIKLPALPLLSVDGHRWRLMVALWCAEPDGDRLEILSSLTLGETSTLPGVYRIVAAIRRLARWVNEDYRIWFKENVLASRLEGESQS